MVSVANMGYSMGNKNNFDPTKLQKYVMWKSLSDIKTCILKTVSINKKTVTFERMYLYDHINNSKIDISRDRNEYDFSFARVSINIEYQTESIEDCMDRLHIIIARNKFNI